MTQKSIGWLGTSLLSILAGLGLVSVPTTGSALTFEEAEQANTIEAYTAVVLGGGSSDDIERALSSLAGLDQSAADSALETYCGGLGDGAGDSALCVTTGTARLAII